MRRAAVIVLLAACSKGEKNQEASAAAMPPEPVVPAEPARPPDEMDEKMRHCPLTVPGSTVIVSEVEGGVRFEIRGSNPAEILKRARHVSEFASGRSAEGLHGGGSGGGKMRNCPIVTNDVAIQYDSIDGGTVISVSTATERLGVLRQETKQRLDRFAFDGVTIERR